MSIRTKILGGFIIVVILGAFLGIIGVISTQMLTSEARNLEQFQHEATSFANILNAHNAWRNSLTESIVAKKEFTGSLDPSTCALGSWLSSNEAKNVTDQQILSLLSQIQEPHDFIHHNAASVSKMAQAGDIDGANDELMNVIVPKLQEVINGLDAIGSRYNELVSEKVLSMETLGTSATVITVAVIAAAVIIATFLALLISGMISKPLAIMAKALNQMGTTGDLRLTPEMEKSAAECSVRKDEIGVCARAVGGLIGHLMNIEKNLALVADGDLTITVDKLSDRDNIGLSVSKLADNLNSMFGEINASTAQVSTGSKQIADGAQILANGSTEQASAVERLSASISEIAEKTKANAQMADKAATLANTIMGNAEKGTKQMDEMMSAVKEINLASQSINKVIKVIDDIAFQTNILALNAAVEAARAGQHGKGFAVVAEEVRNLAAKSAEAAKDTEELIANSMEKAELGARIADETAASLAEIVSGIDGSNQLVSKIARSSEEQSIGISQINDGIDQVAQVVQQNSATAEESAAASKEMSGQADILENLVAQFKLKNKDISSYRSLPPTDRDSYKRLASDSGGTALGTYKY